MSTLFIMDAIKEGFIGIILTLDTLIYGLIGGAFKIFMALAGARLLTSDAYYEIANKLYVVIGVLMLFVLSYSILRGIVDPDPGKNSKDTLGPGMIKRVVIAVLGLALAPSIFNLMYQGQGLFLEQDVLGKIFFRIENTEKVPSVDGEINPDEYVKQIGGSVTATSLWQAFFHPAPDSGKEAKDITVDATKYFVKGAAYGAGCAAGIIILASTGWTGIGLLIGGAVTAAACAAAVVNTSAGSEAASYDNLSLADAYNLTSGGENFGIYTAFLASYTDDGYIEYLFGISTIAGAFALYAFASFSIDMGIRAAKLAYLQIIAPIPLIMQVLPKFKENFNKYISAVISTFLEVFVRISVVYVVVYIICHLSDMFSSADALWGNSDLTGIELMIAYAFLILGLIAFCRHAPEIITQTLGLPKGDMHLGIGKKLAEGGAFSAGSIALGGAQTAISNWRKGKRNDVPLGRRFASSAAGFLSGAGRATRENFIGPNHKEAQTFSDMFNVGSRAAQGAIDARENRAWANEQHQEAKNQMAQYQEIAKNAEAEMAKHQKGSAAYKRAEDQFKAANEALKIAEKNAIMTAPVIRTINKAVEKIDRWSVGTIDTSRDDRRAKFLQSVKELEDQMKSSVAKEDDVKAANRALAQMENMDVEHFAYNEALRNGSAKGRSFDQWKAAEASYLDKERSAIAARQNAEIKRLEDDVKAVTKNAIGRRLAEAASGVDNDTSRILLNYTQSHQAEIDEFKYVTMGIVQDPVLGDVKVSVADYITRNFGESGYSGGLPDYIKISLDSMPKDKKSTYEISYQDTSGKDAVVKVKDSSGREYEDKFKVVISRDQNGASRTIFVDSSGSQVTISDPETGKIVDPTNQEELTRFVRNCGLKKPSFSLKTDSVQNFAVIGNSTTDDHNMYQATFIDALKSSGDGTVRVTFRNSRGDVETAEVVKSGDKFTYKVGSSTYNDENNFFAALDSTLSGKGVNESNVEVISDKAPGNTIISDMKDAAEREYDRFTYTPSHLSAERMKRDQDAKKKNDK